MSFWRVGRKVGRTIYVQLGDQPSDNDELIGVMDTAQMAAEAVEARNVLHARLGPAELYRQALGEHAWRRP